MGQQGRLFLRWNRRSADAMFLLLFSRSVLLPALCDPMDSVAHQAPLSMRFSRKKYRSGLPFPSPGDLLDPGIDLNVSCIGRQILYH